MSENDQESIESTSGEIDNGGHVCSSCGETYYISDWPFCPHGRYGGSIEQDEIPGGITLENYGPNPVTFYSHTERRAYMAEHGLSEKEKFCPMPGTDIDPAGIPNPKGYVDATTLANGRELILRQQGAPTKEWDGVESGVLTDLKTGTLTERDAIAIASGDKGRQSRFARRTDA